MDYYGLDVHKTSITYVRMNEGGRVLKRGRVAVVADAIREVVAPSLGQALVALEATGAWSFVYDLLEPLSLGVVLAHPRRVKAIAAAKVKTDAVDAATLAHLLRTGLLPASYVPPPPVRSWRELLRTRQSLVRMRSACRVRIHALLAKEGLVAPMSDLFGWRGGRWLAAQELTQVHQLLVEVLLRQADALTGEVAALEGALRSALGEHPALARVLQLPGFGFLTAAAFLAEVGEVSRFPRARHLVAYLGLAPRVRASGPHARMGRITKEGPPIVRSYLVQAVTMAVRRPGPCRELYQRVRARSGPQVARVAVARKLAVLAYHAVKSRQEVFVRG